MRFLRLIALALVLIATPNKAAEIQLADLAWTTASNAMVNATAGDTLVFPPGEAIWSGQGLNFTKILKLRGYGTNSTTIRGTNLTSSPIFLWNYNNIPSPGTQGFWISDMTLSYSGGSSAISIGNNPPTTASGHFTNYFHITRVNCDIYSGRGFSLGFGGSQGVVSQCKFRALGAGAQNFIIAGGNEYYSWARPNLLGTTNGIYIEDVYCLGASPFLPSNGHIDGYNGGFIHMRNTVLDGSCSSGTHGYDSQVTGNIGVVMENNRFTNLTGSRVAFLIRSGIMVAISNDFSGATMPTNGVMYLQHYRGAFGSYQMATAMQGVDKTNRFTGTALSGGPNTLVATNVPYGVQYGFDSQHPTVPWAGRSITITGGTGSGQVRVITTAPISTLSADPQVFPGIITFNVSTNWDVNPDNTSTFELNYIHGNTEQIGNQPTYSFTTNTPTGNRSVKIGATLQDTLDNLVACMNGGPGNGTLYSFSGSQTSNWDLSARRDGSSIILHANQDGPGDNGYPGCQMPGVVQHPNKGTNTGVVTFPCLWMGNKLNGTNVGFDLNFTATSPYTYPYFNTNGPLLGRDYYETNALPYTPQPYPLPVRSVLAPADIPFTIGAVGGTSPTITVTADLFANATTLTSGTRYYPKGGTVSLSAPGTSGGQPFVKWTRDLADYSVSATIGSVPVDQSRSFVALYGSPPTVNWTINSTACAATITTTADAATSDTVVSGCETRIYNQTDTITLIAPASAIHPTSGEVLTFVEWQRDGASYSTSTTITPTADTTRDFTAVYLQLGGTVTAKPGTSSRSRTRR